MGRLLVRLDEAGVRRRLVDEGESPLRLFDGRGVDLAELGLGRPKPSTESLSTEVVDEDRRVLAEELVRRELLVDLQSDLQAEGPIVHWLRNRRRGINPSLATRQERRFSARFLPVPQFEPLTARAPVPGTRSARRPLRVPSTGCDSAGSPDIRGAAPGRMAPVRRPSKGGFSHRNRGRAPPSPTFEGGGGADSLASRSTRPARPLGRRTPRSS